MQRQGWVTKLHNNHPVSALQLHEPMITDSCMSGSPSVDKDGRSEGHVGIPEMRGEQAGCCTIRGYKAVTAVPYHFSKTEHILSRYRPIAPKPIAIKPGESAGSAPSDPQSSSTLSFERTSTKASSVCSDGSRGKRTRKRAGADSLPYPRASKRTTTLVPNGRADKLRAVSCKSVAVIGGIEKAVEQFSPDMGGYARPGAVGGWVQGFVSNKDSPSATYITEMAPTDIQPMFVVPGHGRFDREKYGSSFGAIGRKNPHAQLVLDGRIGSVAGDGTSKVDVSAERCVPSVHPLESIVERDSAFMQRAAASTPSGRKTNGFHQKTSSYPSDYAHHLRVGCTPILQGYASHTTSPMVDGSGISQLLEGGYYPTQHPSISKSFGESEVTCAESRKTNLVTLSLLPDTPSLEHTCSEVSVPQHNHSLPWETLRLSIGRSDKEKEEKHDKHVDDADGGNEAPEELHKLTLFSRSGSGAEEEAKRMSSVEEERVREASWSRRSYTSEMHSHPPEGRPLLETLDRDTSASTSSAAWGDAEDRSDRGRERVVDGAYMEQAYWASPDPVMLCDENNTVLWSNQAFMRASSERGSGKDKEVVGPYIDPLGVPTQLSSIIFQIPQGPKVRAVLWGFLKKFMRTQEPSGLSLLAEKRDSADRNEVTESKFLPTMMEDAELVPVNHHTVIAPQPIRPVGSTLSVASITRTNASASPLTENLEFVKEQLDSAQMPAIITDYRDRVRYVNAAYKQMVGQPECLWLSTVGTRTARENLYQNRLTGEVVLICKENLAQLTAAFSCRMLVQWINQGKENRMTVPCEVSRLENERVGPMYVWKLDITAIGVRLPGGGSRQDGTQGK